jgi:hypothetical protein
MKCSQLGIGLSQYWFQFIIQPALGAVRLLIQQNTELLKFFAIHAMQINSRINPFNNIRNSMKNKTRILGAVKIVWLHFCNKNNKNNTRVTCCSLLLCLMGCITPFPDIRHTSALLCTLKHAHGLNLLTSDADHLQNISHLCSPSAFQADSGSLKARHVFQERGWQSQI